jgi:hypothetical protein
MDSDNGEMIRCTTCGTEFSSADAAQVATHAGHSLEHIQQG